MSLARGDYSFTTYTCAVLHQRFKFDVRGCCRKYMTASGKNLRRQAHGFAKVAGQRCERGKKKISEAMALKAQPLLKPMLKQSRKQGLVFRQRDNAVAY